MNHQNNFERIKNKQWKIVIHLLLLSAASKGQDVNFSQFYELPLLRNPGLAGVFVGDMRIQSVYRNQWNSVTVPFQTTGLSAEVNFPVNDYGHYVTGGIQILRDVAGDSKLARTQILPTIAYHVPLFNSDVYLTGALMGGLVTSSFDPSGLRWDDQFVNGQYSPTNPSSQVINSTSRTYLDISGGAALSGPLNQYIDFYVGAGIFHANTPNLSFNSSSVKLARKYVLNGGISFQTSDYQRLTFFGDIFYQSSGKSSAAGTSAGQQQVLMLGGFLTTDLVQYDTEDKKTFSVGAIYRLNDAIAPAIKFDLNKNLSAGLSYDVNISKLTVASGAKGGFELTLAFKTAFTSRIIKSYRMRCVGL